MHLIARLFNSRALSRKSYTAITELVHKVSPQSHVPAHIERPPYARTGHVGPASSVVEIKNVQQVEAMRRSCRVARNVLNIVREKVKVSVVLCRSADKLNRNTLLMVANLKYFFSSTSDFQVLFR